jgi:chemotaxis protein CheD
VIEIFLQPGEYYVGGAECRVRTVLGSCVSVTLWHAKRQVGAMSHFLLADRGAGAGDELDARYAEEAITLMLSELARAKVSARQCQAKIFGGGDMFPQHARKGSVSVGHRNGEAARELMRSHRIAVVAESLYGEGHRQIIFDIGTGHVWSRQIKLIAPTSHAKDSP